MVDQKIIDEAITVNDIGMAAFLKVIKEFPYVQVPFRDKESNKFVFRFGITRDEFAECRTEYLNSEYRRFDNEIKDLKKVLNSPC